MAEPVRKLEHIEGVVTTDELRAVTGINRIAALRKHLEREGIAYFNGKEGPWTTPELLELAGKMKLGIAANSSGKEYY
jgi:hypothetical protein